MAKKLRSLYVCRSCGKIADSQGTQVAKGLSDTKSCANELHVWVSLRDDDGCRKLRGRVRALYDNFIETHRQYALPT